MDLPEVSVETVATQFHQPRNGGSMKVSELVKMLRDREEIVK